MSEAFLVLKLRIKLLSASERIVYDLPGLYESMFSDVNGHKKEYVLMKTCVGLFSRQFQFGTMRPIYGYSCILNWKLNIRVRSSMTIQ